MPLTALPRQSEPTLKCESDPQHDPAIGALRIAGSLPMTLCKPCLQAAVAAWMNDTDDGQAVSFEIRPVAA